MHYSSTARMHQYAIKTQKTHFAHSHYLARRTVCDYCRPASFQRFMCVCGRVSEWSIRSREGLAINELKKRTNSTMCALVRFPSTPTTWSSNVASIPCATSCAKSWTHETNCAAVPSLWRRKSVCLLIDDVQNYHFFASSNTYTLMYAGDRFADA